MIDFDFHIHSNYSSCASQTVSQAVQQAYATGIDTIALCDHNCIQGLSEAKAECDKLGMTFVNGVEISARIGNEIPLLSGYVCHMLGYAFSDYSIFNNRMESLKEQYLLRLRNIADFLYKKKYLQKKSLYQRKKNCVAILWKAVLFVPTKKQKPFYTATKS